MPTTDQQLKYVVLKYLQSDEFSYPVPVEDFFEDLRQSFREIKGAYTYLGTLSCDKVLEEIGQCSGVRLESLSKGIQLAKFIMDVNKDKVEQLCRESHKDRPKTEVDLELIGNEATNLERARRMAEDQKKKDEERLKKSRIV